MDTRAVVLALCGLLCHQTTADGQAEQIDAVEGGTHWSWQWAEGEIMPCKYPALVGQGAVDDYVYLGRAHLQGNLLPALVQPKNDTDPALFAYDDELYSVKSYEVLCGYGLAWEIAGHISRSKPLSAAAVPVGYLENGTVLHACRFVYSRDF